MAGSPFSSPRGPSDGTFRRGGAVARPGKTHPAGRASGATERADGPAERTKSPAPPERAGHPTKKDRSPTCEEAVPVNFLFVRPGRRYFFLVVTTTTPRAPFSP